MTKNFASLGLMSGTSMDGIDLAVIVTDGQKHVERNFPSSSYDFNAQEQQMLKAALSEASRLESKAAVLERFGELQEFITQKHADLVLSYLQEYGSKIPDIDVIGFHGQTVLHRPDLGFTVQLGDGDLLSKLTGIPVVYDMRANDMAHSGQGAPLAPAYHMALANNLPVQYQTKWPVVFVNIGGISNVTFVGDTVTAFDSGPGNNLIDLWMQAHEGKAFDRDGELAASGNINRPVVEELLSHSYFAAKPPKSLDRLDFSLPNAKLKSADMVRTLAHLAAQCVVKAAIHSETFPKLWVICGGGTKNPHIIADLKDLIGQKGGEVVTADELGFSSDFMEAEAWAYLAVRSVNDLPLTYPTTTGCELPISGGVLAEPN